MPVENLFTLHYAIATKFKDGQLLIATSLLIVKLESSTKTDI